MTKPRMARRDIVSILDRFATRAWLARGLTDPEHGDGRLLNLLNALLDLLLGLAHLVLIALGKGLVASSLLGSLRLEEGYHVSSISIMRSTVSSQGSTG